MAYIPNFREKNNVKPKSSGQSNPYYKSDKFYHTEAWKKTAEANKLKNPFCTICKAEGIKTLGKITDHIIPKSKGGAKFDERNLQTLCDPCHNKKRQQERHGKVADFIFNEYGEKIPV